LPRKPFNITEPIIIEAIPSNNKAMLEKVLLNPIRMLKEIYDKADLKVLE